MGRYLKKNKDKNKKIDNHRVLGHTKEEDITIQPKRGNYVVHVPITNVVICVSQRDILCTAGLLCQLVSLMLTFILTLICASVTRKIVTIDRYMLSYYCGEIALILNSVI